MSDRIAVVGAGISGLTSAICLCRVGFDVEIIAHNRSHDTVSIAAAAIWHPFMQKPNRMLAKAARHTYETLQSHADVSDSGVLECDLIEYFDTNAPLVVGHH